MAQAFGGLVRIERLYNESGVWTLASLAQYRKYSVTPLRNDPLVYAFDGATVTPLLGTTFLNNQANTLAIDDATAVVPASYIVKNIGGTVA